jgi:hypothetical protein
VFAVVDHQERLPGAHGFEDDLALGQVSLGREPERRGRGMVERRPVGQAGEVDEPGAFRKLVDDDRRRLERQARLAHAAGSDERDETVLKQPRSQLVDFDLPPEKRRRHGGEIPPEPIQRAQGRKAVNQALADELPHVLGLGEVAEPMDTEVLQADQRRERIVSQIDHGGRHDNLAAVGDAHQARSSVQSRSEPVVSSAVRLAGVHGHAHGDRADLAPVGSRQEALRRRRAADGVAGRREGCAHTVARVFEHRAAGRG